MKKPIKPKVHPMFAFYSNKVGCLGSIAVSIIGTLILAAVLYAMSGW